MWPQLQSAVHCNMCSYTAVELRACAAMQALNIAPALISISPVKTVINPTSPLKVGDSVVKDTLPALPNPPEAAPTTQG